MNPAMTRGHFLTAYERRVVAHHEAGHAVVARRLGLPVVAAEVGVRADPDGHLTSGRAYVRYRPRAAYVRLKARDRVAAAEYAAVALLVGAAGPAAEARFARTDPLAAWHAGGAGDEERAHADLGMTLLPALADAARVVAAPDVWAAVERVAAALDRWGELDAADIDALVRG